MTLVETYAVHDETWFAGEYTMLKVSLDILRDHIFTSTIELDSVVMFGTKGPVVLFDGIATSTPIQMKIDNC